MSDNIGTPRPAFEIEAVATNRALREMGCPYLSTDDRSKVWLEGYSAGFGTGIKEAEALTAKAIDSAFDAREASHG